MTRKEAELIIKAAGKVIKNPMTMMELADILAGFIKEEK